ncbi:MAG: porin, partial [Mycobacterium sp.]|nr:porin [Mycobacterium sp.]
LQGRESIAGGYMENDYLFIQFAGFTFGKAVSQFDPQWALGKPTISSGFLAGSNNATGIAQLAYTAQFGNGVSGTISLEDAQPYRTAGVVNASVMTGSGFISPFLAATVNYGVASANSFTGNASGGDHVPDIVGNLRVDQAWGSLHFGAAAHEVHGTYYTTNGSGAVDGNGRPASTWGYAVTGAFELKNLPTGVGDSLKAEATFSHGAAKYTFGGTVDTAGAGRFAKLGSGTGNTGQSIGFGYVLDGVYANGTNISLANAWDVSAYYEHYWTPAWRTSIFGSVSAISYGSTGNSLLVAAANGGFLTTGSTGSFKGTAVDTGNNFNLTLSQIGTKTAW